MKDRVNPFSPSFDALSLPDCTLVLSMKEDRALENEGEAIRKALENPVGAESLLSIARAKKNVKAGATACILISDNTRPVPYKGENGILVPIIETLFSAGFKEDEITILVATGMHKPMSDEELRAVLDDKVFRTGVRIVNHEPANPDLLRYIGTTERGTRAVVDTRYLDADLKIATGLVESHFMAGASGGRKAICPGIIGEESTYVFHGPALMASPEARDLNLNGNPVHEESLAVAKLAGMDFLVNVTLNGNFEITGVFAGDLEKAHYAAVEKLRDAVSMPIKRKHDVVITHAGFVGINHYQAAKCAVASLGALKENGYLIILADATDRKGVIGSANYRTTLALLKLVGSDNFVRLIKSPDWTFLPEQWQVQQWAKLFWRISQNHLFFYAPQIKDEEFDLLPGRSIRELFTKEERRENDNREKGSRTALERALEEIAEEKNTEVENLDCCYLSEGPYGIPVVEEEK